jgi:hypothetical protein
MFDPKADLFFESPENNRIPPGEYGVLHLLRRDICSCLGWDPTTKCRTSHPTLWPGGMAILAGIDLVAKFCKGDDAVGQVGARFRYFVINYFDSITSGNEETIYQLRNALLHSFGLYSQAKSRTYRFRLSANGGSLIQRFPGDVYQVDLVSLYGAFESSLQKYSDELNKDEAVELRRNFLKMFPNYGSIYIG